MNPFQSLHDYECFVYALQTQFLEITSSTLIIKRRGKFFAELSGELRFRNGHWLVVYERLSWNDSAVHIAGYGYEVWHGREKLFCTTANPTPMNRHSGLRTRITSIRRLTSSTTACPPHR